MAGRKGCRWEPWTIPAPGLCPFARPGKQSQVRQGFAAGLTCTIQAGDRGGEKVCGKDVGGDHIGMAVPPFPALQRSSCSNLHAALLAASSASVQQAEHAAFPTFRTHRPHNKPHLGARAHLSETNKHRGL